MPATLENYWQGAADWKLAAFYPRSAYQLFPGDGGFGAGTMIRVGADGTWYWFYRTILNPSTTCSVYPSTGTLVRKSADHGKSWSGPARVVEALPGTPWACDATDGDAYWDGAQWFYLFQCRTDPARPSPWGDDWNTCLVRNRSADPTMGTWEPVGTDPVMGSYPGAYNPWPEICDTVTDRCSLLAGATGRVTTPGTPSIFDVPSEPGWHFVDLHGVDPQGLQYQTVIKTQDFITYVATGTNLPGDSIFDREDAMGWREPALNWRDTEIGGGGGAVFRNPADGLYYNLVEASNGAGGCYGDVVDIGILRAASPAETAWSQPTMPGRENPIQYSQQTTLSEEIYTARCTPSYTNIFWDPVTKETYMSFVRRSSDRTEGVYVFKLAANLLANGDAWRCIDTAPWRLASPSVPPSSFAIWRDGNWASDGACYLALRSDITQDVRISAGSTPSVTWGGKLAGRRSTATPPMGYQSLPGSGTVKLTLTQLNATGSVVTTASVNVSLPSTGTGYGNYKAATASTTIRSTTTSLRFTVSPGTTGLTLLADELFIKPA